MAVLVWRKTHTSHSSKHISQCRHSLFLIHVQYLLMSHPAPIPTKRPKVIYIMGNCCKMFRGLCSLNESMFSACHDDVIKWKHFPRYWPFARRIHRSPVNSPHKGQWRGALMFSLICVWINDSVNNGEAGDLRRYRIHYDVIVMLIEASQLWQLWCFIKHSQ